MADAPAATTPSPPKPPQRPLDEATRHAALVDMSAAPTPEDVKHPYGKLVVDAVAERLRRKLPAIAKPYPFQLTAMAFAKLTRYCCMIADPPGLGKSLDAIGTFVVDPVATLPAIVVAPANVLYNWQAEMKKWAPYLPVVVLNKRSSELPPTTFNGVVITTFGLVSAHATRLASRGFKTLVVDEAHRIKNLKAQQTKAAIQIASYVDNVMLLTGTPLKNRLVELHALLDVVADFGDTEEFAEQYTEGTDKELKNGRVIRTHAGSRNEDELRERLATVMIRRLKEDVAKFLPSKTRTYIPVELSVEQRREYTRAEYDFNKWAKSADAKSNIAAAMVQIGVLRRIVGKAKVEPAIEQIEAFLDNGLPLVVFAVHRETVALLRAGLEARGVKFDVIDGSVSPKRRFEIVKAFQAGELEVVVGSEAMKEGITLTKASDVLFVERFWSPADEEQGEDRCVVEGQNVLTSEGWLPIERVGVGARVLTAGGRLRRVAAVSAREHKAKLTEIRYRRFNLNLRVTSDHQVLVKRGENLVWVEAQHVEPHQDFMVTPRWLEKGAPVAALTFPPDLRHDPMHFNQFGQPMRNGRYVRMPDAICVDADLVALFGWYVAEGWASIAPGKSSFISLSGHLKERVILERHGATLTRVFGVRCSIYASKRNNAIELRACSRELARWFIHLFGRISEDVHFPEELLKGLSPELLRIMLDSYLEGDGYSRSASRYGVGAQHECITVSPKLAAQLALILGRLGESATVRYVDNEHNHKHWIVGYTEGGNPDSPRLRANDERFVYQPVTSVTTKPECAKVYDLTVDLEEGPAHADVDERSFVVGQAVVHNCHRIGSVNAVTIWFLHANGTIDDRIRRLVDKKRALVKKILGAGNVAEGALSLSNVSLSDFLADVAEHRTTEAAALAAAGPKKAQHALPKAAIRALLFDPSKWSPSDAQRWAGINGLEAWATSTIGEGSKRRIRVTTSAATGGAVRVVKIAEGVSAVVSATALGIEAPAPPPPRPKPKPNKRPALKTRARRR